MPPYAFIRNGRIEGELSVEKQWIRKGPATPEFEAVDVLLSCEMDYLVMGMSAATFWNGRQGASDYLDKMKERAQVGVSCGSFATEAALNVYKAKRIAFLSPQAS
jgi:maleate cis-trans isomerase